MLLFDIELKVLIQTIKSVKIAGEKQLFFYTKAMGALVLHVADLD